MTFYNPFKAMTNQCALQYYYGLHDTKENKNFVMYKLHMHICNIFHEVFAHICVLYAEYLITVMSAFSKMYVKGMYTICKVKTWVIYILDFFRRSVGNMKEDFLGAKVIYTIKRLSR